MLFDINDININHYNHQTCPYSYEKGHQTSHKVFAFQFIQNNKRKTTRGSRHENTSRNRCLDQSRIVGDQHQTALKPLDKENAEKSRKGGKTLGLFGCIHGNYTGKGNSIKTS